MSFRVSLCKENITAIALMQQTTYLNVQAYVALQHKDFSLSATQKEHELLSTQMFRICGLSPTVPEFSYIYDESVWRVGLPGLSKEYRVQLLGKELTYFLRIEFEKPLFKASQICMQFPNKEISEFVRTNLFDIKFFSKDNL